MSQEKNPFGKVEAIEKLDAKKGPAGELEEMNQQDPSNEKFQSLMTSNHTQPPVLVTPTDQVQGVAKPSPMEEMTRVNKATNENVATTRNNLVAQVDQVSSRMGEVRDALQKEVKSPTGTVPANDVSTLNSKLTHIDESLKVALSKVGLESKAKGVEGTEKVGASQSQNPILRFLDYLGDGEKSLNNLSSELNTMGKNNQQLSAVNMLAVQVKVGHIQQELELFTTILSKSLESIKTIMNIQV